jgi:chromosome segregation ATPase
MSARGTVPAVEEDCQRLRVQLAELGELFGKRAERLDEGLSDEEQFRSRNETLLQQKTQLQAQLADLESRVANREAVEVGLAQVKQVLSDFGRVWEHMTIEEKREMLRNLIEELAVGKGKGTLELPFLPTLELKWPVRGGGS